MHPFRINSSLSLLSEEGIDEVALGCRLVVAGPTVDMSSRDTHGWGVGESHFTDRAVAVAHFRNGDAGEDDDGWGVRHGAPCT